MPVGSVHVAMRQLLLRRGAHVLDLDVEIEVLAGKGMIAVERHHVARYAGHSHGARAFLGLRM